MITLLYKIRIDTSGDKQAQRNLIVLVQIYCCVALKAKTSSKSKVNARRGIDREKSSLSLHSLVMDVKAP